MKIYFIIFLILLLSINNSWASDNDIIQKCEAAISKKFAKWQRASVTDEVNQWSKSRGKSPTEVYGDFNGDTYQDVALLIQVNPNPRNDNPEKQERPYIAICLNNQPNVFLYLIKKPYCIDYIYLSPKEKKYHDYDTGKTGRYRLDGVGAACFERAGATYVYSGKKFIQIVDSD